MPRDDASILSVDRPLWNFADISVAHPFRLAVAAMMAVASQKPCRKLASCINAIFVDVFESQSVPPLFVLLLASFISRLKPFTNRRWHRRSREKSPPTN